MINSVGNSLDSLVLQTPAEAKKREQAEKHRARARAYYLRHRDEVIERAKNNYYRKQEEREKTEEAAEAYAGTAAGKDEKPEGSVIAVGEWGSLVGIGMIVAAVVWVVAYVIRELQSKSAASVAAQGSKNLSVPQERQIAAAQPPALSEQGENFAEIRRIIAGPPYNCVA